MLRLFLRTTMKRAQRSTKASQSKQTSNNYESNDNGNSKLTTTRQTRSKKPDKQDKPATSEEAKVASTVDLSRFQIENKQKLKSESGKHKQLVKRQHVNVEYDEDSVKDRKIKKEANNDGDNAHASDSNTVDKKQMPSNWEEVLQNLQEMRKSSDAPVDTMGCERCPDENATDEDKRFQTLLSLMLSSQTKDQVTHAAMLKLREHGCSLTNILNTSDEKLGQLIYPVCFWKTKVKNIKRTSEMIKDKFNGDIPNTIEDLCKLPGVGPKMAHLCMKTAWGQITGIGVDTHVHRITNRLGWVKTKNPEETRKALEDWLPFDLWSEVNLLLVGFGQQICRPIKPQCSTCLNNQLCPFGRKEVRSKGKAK